MSHAVQFRRLPGALEPFVFVGDEHASQAIVPAWGPMLSSAQVSHSELPVSSACFPGMHLKHSVAVVLGWNLPPPQARHSLPPRSSMNFPFGHELQELWPVALVTFPTAHSVQPLAPLRVLYFPAAQAVQEVLLDALLKVPTEHSEHSEELVCENFPAGPARGRQAERPTRPTDRPI
jgi:hypothetical protein